MTDENGTDDLGDLFESITGETTVVQTQQVEADTRDVSVDPGPRTVDTIEYHGLADAIDGPEAGDAADASV
ncbi:MAG: hypothetical protein ABEH66_08350 [Halobacteriales archaeon]